MNPGIRIPHRWRGPILLGGVAAIVLSIVGTLSLIRYSSGNPSFCLTCHGQGATPLAVSATGHTSKIPCIGCHGKAKFPIAQGFPQSFSADPGDVDKKCRSCHKEVGTGEPRIMQVNVQGIKIPHKLHAGDMGVACVQCHVNIAHDAKANPTNRPSMEVCGNCHNTQENCQKCHRKEPTAMAPAAGNKSAS